jgi:hypothetical protein
MKSYDKLIIGILIVFSLIGYIGVQYLNRPLHSKFLVIEVDGKEHSRIGLLEDEQDEKFYEVKQPKGQFNIVLMVKGGVRMIEANCPDKLCIHQGRIERQGPLIVCLPNRVVLRIVGGEEGDID